MAEDALKGPRIALLSAAQALLDGYLKGDDIDAQQAPLTREFAKRGVGFEKVSWDSPEYDPKAYLAVMPLFLWDYADNPTGTTACLERTEAETVLFNPFALIRWNMDKRYLRDVTEAGLPTLKTLWLDTPTPDAVSRAFDALNADDIVVKRVVGAGARGQYRLRRGDAAPNLDRAVPHMVQAFEPAIVEEGEYSLLVFNGVLSHALIKRPAAGDYRIQPQYGGRMEAVRPTDAMHALARQAFDTIEARGLPRPVYARVDLLRGQDGALRVIELELFEPYLYPHQGPGFETLFVDAVMDRLA